jgi:hypothetical protein
MINELRNVIGLAILNKEVRELAKIAVAGGREYLKRELEKLTKTKKPGNRRLNKAERLYSKYLN